MKRFALVAAIGLLAMACGGGGGAAGSSSGGGGLGNVKIGVLEPVSGANASSGQDTLHGIEVAADVLNGKLAVPGLPKLTVGKVQLVTQDTESNPQVGAAAVDQLVRTQKVAAMIGAYQSNVSLVAAQRADRLGVPFVNAASSSPKLTQTGLSWFFHTGPSDVTFTNTFFDFLKAEHPVKRVDVIHENDEFGNDGAQAVSQLAPRYGVEVADTVVYQTNSTDLTSQVQKIRADQPDALFAFAYTNDAILLTKTMAQLGYTPPAILAYGAGWVDPKFIPTLGSLANDAMTRAAWAPSYTAKSPAAKAVADYFQRQYGLAMTENSARSFTGMMVLGQAIEKAASTDPDKIRNALRSTDITQTIMPWPGVKFDANGQNTEARGEVLQIQNGRYETLYPQDAATAKLVWPMPPLTGRS